MNWEILMHAYGESMVRAETYDEELAIWLVTGLNNATFAHEISYSYRKKVRMRKRLADVRKKS